jgi:hypothetical protein
LTTLTVGACFGSALTVMIGAASASTGRGSVAIKASNPMLVPMMTVLKGLMFLSYTV